MTIEHPPRDFENTQAGGVEMYDAAPGITQLNDPCLPGKHVIMAQERRFNGGTLDACHSDAWKLDGCRTFYRSPLADEDAVDVFAAKPYFATFPPDVSVTQHGNPLPDFTGEPVPDSLCGTPFKMTWRDAPPILSSCGVWEIARTWKIEPRYLDCDAKTLPSDHPLVTETVQLITVTDTSAPTFVHTPDETVHVPFLTDYGPSVAGVPKAADIALNAHVAQLNMTSYPIQVEYVDTVEFSEMPSTICSSGLATVTRVWTTSDSCGLHTTWTQRIVVIQNKALVWGEASAYQVSTVHLCTSLSVSDHKKRAARPMPNYSHPTVGALRVSQVANLGGPVSLENSIVSQASLFLSAVV